MSGQLKKQISCLFLVFFTVCSFVVPVMANTSPFRPSDGTSSTYSWSFNGFTSVGTINGTHIDIGNHETYNFIMMDNPTHAELNITYSTYEEFLEESIDITMYNDTYDFDAHVTYLINITTREYYSITQPYIGATTGYIDPTSISIGSQILVSTTLLNVTAKETTTIAGTSRKSWKLEGIFSYNNITCHYDTETGVLLKMKFDTAIGSIGGSSSSSNTGIEQTSYLTEELISSHSQELISTNAFITSNTTPAAFIEALFAIVALVVLPRAAKQRRKIF